MDLKTIRLKVNTLRGQYDHAKRQVADELDGLEEAEKELEAATNALHIVTGVAQTIQQKAHDRIASVVSRCLEAVFDEPYTFKILFERKRGKTEARLVFLRSKLEVDPLTASGGGVVDVAAFALRLACLLLTSPSPRRFIALDEPMKFLSVEYRSRVRNLLRQLSEELKIQFLMVTHDQEFRLGHVVELT